MAAANVEATAVPQGCGFRWEIRLPFTHPRSLRTTFLAGNPPVTQWNAILNIYCRRVNRIKFKFVLRFDPVFDERADIVVTRLQVGLALNGIILGGVDHRNLHFRRVHFYVFGFRADDILRFVQEDSEVIVVTLTMLFPPINRDARRDEPYVRGLSEDLEKLLTRNTIFPNALLRAADGTMFHAHSYIINVRWTNFDEVQENEPDNFLQTNISCRALASLLHYLYSGKLNNRFRSAGNVSSVPLDTELFQLIFKYKLFHMYQAFFPNNWNQRFVTVLPKVSTSKRYPLVRVFVRPTEGSTRPWFAKVDTQFQSAFVLEVRNRAGPWLSYKLQSRCSVRISAQVNLEIKKKVVPSGVICQTIFVYQGLHDLLPFQIVNSGGVVFLGCPETFRDIGQHMDIEYEIHCTLIFANTRKIDRMQTTNNDRVFENSNIHVLADHLFELRRTQMDSDLRAFPFGDKVNYIGIHKAIFGSRTYHWWNEFGNVDLMNTMPDQWHSTMSTEFLSHVLDFLYTGRTFYIPADRQQEIAEFANRSNCHYLSKFVETGDSP